MNLPPVPTTALHPSDHDIARSAVDTARRTPDLRHSRSSRITALRAHLVIGIHHR
jgi:hypothetical protein